MSNDKMRALHQALLAVNAVAIERGDKFGVCDQIDNTGQPYQSQWLADLLAEPPAALAAQAQEAPSEPASVCQGMIAVPRDAIEWLKKHYPALCEKAGLCERIGGKLYTRTSLARPASASAQAAVPDGWKLVPVEPTPEMCKEGNDASAWHVRDADDIYRAMLAAAPSTQQGGGE